MKKRVGLVEVAVASTEDILNVKQQDPGASMVVEIPVALSPGLVMLGCLFFVFGACSMVSLCVH